MGDGCKELHRRLLDFNMCVESDFEMFQTRQAENDPDFDILDLRKQVRQSAKELLDKCNEFEMQCMSVSVDLSRSSANSIIKLLEGGI